jgi:hypothetical protein
LKLREEKDEETINLSLIPAQVQPALVDQQQKRPTYHARCRDFFFVLEIQQRDVIDDGTALLIKFQCIRDQFEDFRGYIWVCARWHLVARR